MVLLVYTWSYLDNPFAIERVTCDLTCRVADLGFGKCIEQSGGSLTRDRTDENVQLVRALLFVPVIISLIFSHACIDARGYATMMYCIFILSMYILCKVFRGSNCRTRDCRSCLTNYYCFTDMLMAVECIYILRSVQFLNYC